MNSPASLSEQLLAQLQGAPLQQISQQLGTDVEQTQQAVSAALPMLLGALGQQAAQPQGAQALLGALQRDHTGNQDLGGLLASLMGGENGADADGILGHIFGGKQSQAQTGLGQATGIGSGGAGNLLKLLAPLVMAFLAQRASAGSMSADSLGDTLGHERDTIRQQGGVGGGLLGSLLDQNGDGQLDMSDLIKIGGTLFGGRR